MNLVLGKLKAFFAFWYDFVVGDDWRVAAAVVIALAITYGVSQSSVSSWWIMPVAVAAVLWFSVRRVVRRAS
ncbi:MAG: hypothetical protein FWC87_11790 [Acidimicrobiaceae bacterium]|nr:hypothetical protein [Acidimicrobiaceae bacterium]